MTRREKASIQLFNKTAIIPFHPCWEWTGSKLPSGYGTLSASNGSKKTNKTYYAHRLSWELANGRKLKKGMYACHTCDNPSCVNPDHLFEGTPTDNMRDCIKKKRFKPVPEGMRGQYLASLTHCKNGHRFDEENTYLRNEGGRKCKKCSKDANEKFRRRIGRKKRKLSTSTHCVNGHLFDEANTHYDKNGKRRCRACVKLQRKNIYEKRRLKKKGQILAVDQ